jgi:hypothetical protein
LHNEANISSGWLEEQHHIVCIEGDPMMNGSRRERLKQPDDEWIEGDPLSPMIFILVMDTVVKMLLLLIYIYVAA